MLRVGPTRAKESPLTAVMQGAWRGTRPGKTNRLPLNAFKPLNNGEHDMKVITATALAWRYSAEPLRPSRSVLRGRDYGYDSR